MDNTTKLTWQMTIIMALSIAIFGGGTMALLMLGREVPGALWAIVGALANAIVSLGGFFNMRQMHATSLGHLAQLQANQEGRASLPISGTTTISTGSEGSTS